MENSMTEERWQAIIQNDSTYNGKFFYAVKTTGVFCRPSCKSRVPKKENVLIFQNAGQAMAAHFRPCKRCNPTEERLPEQGWVDEIKEYIEKNYKERLTLDTLSSIFHGSPYHLQRTFKKMNGITPVEYVQQIRINKAKEYLIQTKKTVTDISMSVGITNATYFITLFKKKTGYTPEDYRRLEVAPHGR